MHKTVLLQEAVELLNIKKGDIAVDATLGEGGHTIELARKVGKNGKVISIDVDQSAIENSKKRIGSEHPELLERIIFVQGNFADLAEMLENLEIEKVNVILADLGWRIEQVEDANYGMSFARESQLDMKLNRGAPGPTAHEIVNSWSESRLEDIFWEYGEEKNARKIAKAVAVARKTSPIETTVQLARIIELKYKPKRKSRLHAATKVFQALRIAVNDELGNLERLLVQSVVRLGKGGRIAVISFHSLEDRIVKEFFRTNARGCVCPREFPVCVCGKEKTLKIVTKKPQKASRAEIRENPRARSARLRVAEKL